MKIFEYTVEGISHFPLDMLRRDRCWPRRTEDALNIPIPDMTEGHFFKKRSVTLQGICPPTSERWNSFGWDVGVTKEIR